jgi:hypothetical protein
MWHLVSRTWPTICPDAAPATLAEQDDRVAAEHLTLLTRHHPIYVCLAWRRRLVGGVEPYLLVIIGHLVLGGSAVDTGACSDRPGSG